MRKRSKYRPRELMVDPLSVMRPVEKADASKIMIRLWSALSSLRSGSGRYEEMRDMSDVINLAETLCSNQRRMDGNVMELVHAAASGLIEAANAPTRIGGFRLSGWALESMEILVDSYAQCIEGGLSAHDMALAERITNRRIEKLRRQIKPGTRVVSI